MKHYEIRNKNRDFYLPSVEFWIMDDLSLSLRQAMLYKLIMFKEFLTWDNAYMAYVLRCGESTIKRDLQDLEARDLIVKTTKLFGSRLRRVLVARYTKRGARSERDIAGLLDAGILKLDAEYGNIRSYKKRR